MDGLGQIAASPRVAQRVASNATTKRVGASSGAHRDVLSQPMPSPTATLVTVAAMADGAVNGPRGSSTPWTTPHPTARATASAVIGTATVGPDLTCLAPVRDLALTRDVAIDYAVKHDLPIETTKNNPFSIDQNVWGRAIETGFLEDIWNAPTKDVYNYTDDPTYPPLPDEVVITFDQGVPVAIDGRPVTPLQAIQEMNRRAGAQGIGRIDIVEDRLVGIKSREIYEAPGAIALITAHKELENVTIEREQARFKSRVDERWSELVYDGQWFSPLKRSLDAFIDDTQTYVSGDIRMTLHGGRATVTGRRSETSLYDFNLATYETGDTYDQTNARGFIEIFGMTSKLAAARDAKYGRGVTI